MRKAEDSILDVAVLEVMLSTKGRRMTPAGGFGNGLEGKRQNKSCKLGGVVIKKQEREEE